MQEGESLETLLHTTQLLMRFSIKDVKGIFYHDGSPMELKFDEQGSLLDASIDELMGMEMTTKLNTALAQFANGIPTEIVDENGKPLEDVKILPMPGVNTKKKST